MSTTISLSIIILSRFIVLVTVFGPTTLGWCSSTMTTTTTTTTIITKTLTNRQITRRNNRKFIQRALSSDYIENDLVAVAPPLPSSNDNDSGNDNISQLQEQNEQRSANTKPRFCVVRPDGTVSPLCQHEDDVETDLFADPRCFEEEYWKSVTNDQIVGTYGEGWYAQRPVPSLGGGPGYGADADEIWSVNDELLAQLEEEGVELPILDVGIAHGEKARGGSLF